MDMMEPYRICIASHHMFNHRRSKILNVSNDINGFPKTVNATLNVESSKNYSLKYRTCIHVISVGLNLLFLTEKTDTSMDVAKKYQN